MDNIIKIRIGNDIPLIWKMYTQGESERVPYNLEGRDIKIEMTNCNGGRVAVAPEINGNAASWNFKGKEQKNLGEYTLTFYENYGKDGMKALDKIKPFALVPWQEVVQSGVIEGSTSTLEVDPIVIESNLGQVVDYNKLINKPKINHIVLIGDKTLEELGIASAEDLAQENARAQSAEQALASAIGAEAQRAKAKEAELEGKIDIRTHPYTSLERIKEYLYKVTFDRLPEDNGGESPVIAGCSSYVAGGKLYTNLDWDYDDTASFIVKTRDFEGQSFIKGLDDGAMDDALIAQLPYRVHRGVNNYGIKVASHILFNDWDWTGCGERSINLTRLPFLVLTRVRSMATISQDLSGILGNLYAPDGLKALDYLLQILVTDGTTTYALMPPTSEGQGYVLQNITANPKLANFRWVASEQVERAELQRRPTGVERWNMMPCPLADLRFTKAYEQPTRLSEFIGLRGTTKDSADAQLEAIYTDARAEYLQRERDGKTWQTMESAVYGDRLEALYIQEDWSKNFIPATTEYVDKVASELAGAIGDETERAQGAESNLNDAIEAEETRANAKEGELSTAISSEATRATNAESGLDTRLTNVEGKIPSQATSTNKLADKAFVNSSIATETAHYISDDGEPFTSVSDLPTEGVTNNDYAFVTGTDSEGNIYFDRYKASVTEGVVSWAKEYRLNNSSFTAAHWAAIQSGITSGLVGKLNDLPTNEALLQLLAGKADAVHTHNLSDIENIEMLSQEEMLQILNS